MENFQQMWAVVGSYALTGAIISALVQVTKTWIRSHGGKVVWAILFSVAGGAGIYALQLLPGEVIVVIAGVYAAANTVYAIFLNGQK